MNRAWIDLETTGSDEHDGSILEVAIIVTDEHLRELARDQWIVAPHPPHVEAMPDVVRRMHTDSGLLAALDGPDCHDVADVDLDLRSLLNQHATNGQLILAGSGVGHFDSRWIRLHLPRSARRLTYYTHDVGVVRRFLESVDPALVIEQYPAGGKPHRAMADAELHLAEWIAYRNAMREAAPAFATALARKSSATS